MKFQINREVLLNGLLKASKAVNSKTPIIAQQGIKLVLNYSGLELTGSNNDLWIKTFISKEINSKDIIKIDEIGSVVISEKFLIEIIRKIEDEDIEIEVFENNLAKIRSSRSEFNLNCIPVKDYPVLDFSLNGHQLSLDSLELKTILESTIFAASDKEARAILTGLNIKCAEGVLECIATDSFRLAKKIIKVTSEAKFNVTVPTLSLLEINKIIDCGYIEIYFSDNKVTFKLNDSIVSTRVISGSYPDTSKLIPQTFSHTLKVSNKDINGAVDRASVLSVDKNSVVRLKLNKNEILISSKSVEIGSVNEVLTDFNFEGEELVISFSSKYLVDALKAISNDEVELRFNGEMKPIVIVSNKDQTMTQLILPVRTYN